MKHKHADLIHAWADGAEIQRQSKVDGVWETMDEPDWDIFYEYRIKPEEKKPVVRWLWAYQCTGSKEWINSTKFYSDDEIKYCHLANPLFKLEWSRTEFPE